MTVPHANNFCGGNFKDWLEVMLLPECNAHCSWCIEKRGYKPTTRADYQTIAEAAINTKKQNIILLGGEPTLYPQLPELIQLLSSANRNVYLTTNGSNLSVGLEGLTGINISIHDYNLEGNRKITGLYMSAATLQQQIATLKDAGVKVRFNCNCIQGHIDSRAKVLAYIKWAKEMGADSVRFAELKLDSGSFVNIAAIMGYQYGLNDEPFTCGCNTNAVIEDLPVNFRQMCGMQTELRPMPCDPKQDAEKSVLYYDGKIYDGWQVTKKEEVVTDRELVKLLEEVAAGTKSVAEAALVIGRETKKVKEVVRVESGGGCRY